MAVTKEQIAAAKPDLQQVIDKHGFGVVAHLVNKFKKLEKQRQAVENFKSIAAQKEREYHEQLSQV